MTTLGGLCKVQVPAGPGLGLGGNQAGRQWREVLSLKLVRRRRSCWRRAGGSGGESAVAVAGVGCGVDSVGVGVGVGEDIGRWMVARVRRGVLGPLEGLLCGGVGRLSIVVCCLMTRWC